MKVITINVCGIRASQKKGLFEWLKRAKADFICMQETRALEEQVSKSDFFIKGYERYMNVAEKKGYSGVAIYTKHKPLAIQKSFSKSIFEREGRFILTEFKDFDIVSVYFPSGSSGEERQKIKYDFMSKFEKYMKKIKKSRKPTIISGDWNIVHKEIDIKNWKSNQKNSGCLPKERAWLDKIFDKYGFVDAFRFINDKPHNYTWWSNRGNSWENNVGWRIDYQAITPHKNIIIKSAEIYKRKRFSDHSPLIINYEY